MFGFLRRKAREPSANDKVRAALSQHGDSGRAPRHVLHFVWPASDEAAPEGEVLDWLRENGLRVDPAKASKGFIGEETREVASAEFDRRTQEIETAMRARGWTYDGWECAVRQD